jgi:hypothetical protein
MYDGPEVGGSGGWRWKAGWEWAAVGYDNNVDPSLGGSQGGIRLLCFACLLPGWLRLFSRCVRASAFASSDAVLIFVDFLSFVTFKCSRCDCLLVMK